MFSHPCFFKKIHLAPQKYATKIIYKAVKKRVGHKCCFSFLPHFAVLEVTRGGRGSYSIPVAIFHRESARWCQRAQTGAGRLTIAETYRFTVEPRQVTLSELSTEATLSSARLIPLRSQGRRGLLVHTAGIQGDSAWLLTVQLCEEAPLNERVSGWFLVREPCLQAAWQLVNKTSWILCEVANTPHIPVWKTRQSFVMVLCWLSLIITTMILLINCTELCPNTKKSIPICFLRNCQIWCNHYI